MADYPQPITPVNHMEPVPRRIRATIGATTSSGHHPGAVRLGVGRLSAVLHPAGRRDRRRPGRRGAHAAAQPRHRAALGLRVGDVAGPAAARVYTDDAIAGLPGMVRFDWDALDAWFEEDEQVFVHPRSPYTRVDAIRSTRAVRVELDGVVLAESASPVMVFETGLPTRYYLNRTEVDFDAPDPQHDRTACPYKGTTSGYWSAQDRRHGAPRSRLDLRLPDPATAADRRLVAFYNEKVDIFVDGRCWTDRSPTSSGSDPGSGRRSKVRRPRPSRRPVLGTVLRRHTSTQRRRDPAGRGQPAARAGQGVLRRRGRR